VHRLQSRTAPVPKGPGAPNPPAPQPRAARPGTSTPYQAGTIGQPDKTNELCIAARTPSIFDHRSHQRRCCHTSAPAHRKDHPTSVVQYSTAHWRTYHSSSYVIHCHSSQRRHEEAYQWLNHLRAAHRMVHAAQPGPRVTVHRVVVLAL
jgi:hypothetical protein